MPTLDNHQSDKYIKLLYIGNSSSGKTGSLTSLLEDGYSFKIIDMDNGLDSLKGYARSKQLDLSKIEFETYRDKYKGSKAGPVVDGSPKAFTSALDKMTEWSTIEDENTIFVLDSLTLYGRAAFQWAKGMNPMAKDGRNWFFSAQQAIESTLALLTSDDFKMNVIVISHVNYGEDDSGVRKGFASAIGSALGPIIPDYFNTLILAETSGSGANVRRKIKTIPTGIIDLKIPIPEFDKELPLETGLSVIFKQLKGQ